MSSSEASEDDDDGLALLVGAFARRAKPSRPPPLEEEEAVAVAKPNSLHEVTAEPSKGLGAQLSGSINPLDDLWWPDSLPWDSTSSSSADSTLPPSPPAAHAAHLEIMRFRHLAALRAKFHELCAAAGLPSPPINALERWRFSCKWQDEGAAASDPLLPTGEEQPADGALASDLRRAGLTPAAADELVASVRAASLAAAADIANQHAELQAGTAPPAALPALTAERLPGDVLRLRLARDESASAAGAAGTAGAAVDTTDVSVRVTQAAVDKLRALHRRHCPDEAAPTTTADSAALGTSAAPSVGAAEGAWSAFDARLFALLLRYEAIGGAGFQAALGGNVLRALQHALETNFECFASPLNCYYGHYCSAFPDVDRPFGSRGSFTRFAPARGSYEANPPFVDALIDDMATRLLALLDTAQAADEPLCFAVVLPGWADNPGYRALLAAPLLRRTLLVAAADHGYIDGAQHARPRAYRLSTYDTRVFVLQSDAHLRAHPLDDAAMATLETSLAACTPSSEPKAQGGEQDERGGHSGKDGATGRDAPACLQDYRSLEAHRRKKRRKGK